MWITEALSIWQTEQQKTVDKPTLLDYLSYSLYMVSQHGRNRWGSGVRTPLKNVDGPPNLLDMVAALSVSAV